MPLHVVKGGLFGPRLTAHCHEVKLNHSISGLLFCKRV
jgi:hypothetical protein